MAQEPCSTPDCRLTRQHRITRSADFADTFSQGQHWVGRKMVLWVRRGPGACSRLGVVASRKVGGAVARTRAKRRLREVFRQHRYKLVEDVDVVLVGRRAILKATHAEAEGEFLNLAAKAKLLRPTSRKDQDVEA